ncbi:MAG: precorrin-4 C(11)-methyltransferase [Desulfocapsaceae bacterium]|jgi:precorrin-4/cobalt-precorrin-4 C11-methyltransferase|nr:precorrin-4 C(11)-methyltransferase [Desulfocapsaceae bacterium]
MSKSVRKGKVFFIGAGPGAPDLITLRGKKVIDTADRIIYAGSLVNRELFASNTSDLHDSSGLHLDEIINLISESVEKGGIVARVHTGDPSLYGAIREQMLRLQSLQIDYEVVPGVTSAFGAAAALGVELTLPELTQTVIITRKAGRTPVPEQERLDLLASHGATMMVFLSVGMISGVVEDLVKGGYSTTTPVSVVQRATWPDQKIISGSLETIAEKVRREGVTKTAIICVGSVFGDSGLKAESKLYDKTFSHGTRKAGSNHQR